MRSSSEWTPARSTTVCRWRLPRRWAPAPARTTRPPDPEHDNGPRRLESLLGRPGRIAAILQLETCLLRRHGGRHHLGPAMIARLIALVVIVWLLIGVAATY